MREDQWPSHIRNGDRQAFKEMFYAYYPRLCAFAAEYVGSPQWARDVVQEVFLNIWKRRHEWTVRSSVKAYLYQAVRNRALNTTRRTQTRNDALDHLKEDAASVTRHTAEDQMYYYQLSDAVDQAIDELPPRRRMVFLLHRKHDFTYAEIAQIMDITAKTVENQMGRALKFLRERLTRDVLSEL